MVAPACGTPTLGRLARSTARGIAGRRKPLRTGALFWDHCDARELPMDATEIRQLTREALAELLAGRTLREVETIANGRRQTHRWPFPGQVQLCKPDESGIEQVSFGTCLNLSLYGLGMLYDEPLPVGLELSVSIHQPEASLHGRAIVRHCTENEAGYYIGAQFLFDET